LISNALKWNGVVNQTQLKTLLFSRLFCCVILFPNNEITFTIFIKFVVNKL